MARRGGRERRRANMPDWELIAIDDGSTDDTPRILGEWERRDRRIRVDPPGRAGAGGGPQPRFGRRARAAAGAPRRRRPRAAATPGAAVAHLDAHPGIGLLGSWAQKIDERGTRRGELKPATEPEQLSRALMQGNPFVHSSVMFRTEAVRRLNGFRPAFRAAEDYDLWLRIAETAKLANLPEALIEYRWHSGNVTNRNAIRQAFSVRLAQRSAQARPRDRPRSGRWLERTAGLARAVRRWIVLCRRRGALSSAGTGRSGDRRRRRRFRSARGALRRAQSRRARTRRSRHDQPHAARRACERAADTAIVSRLAAPAPRHDPEGGVAFAAGGAFPVAGALRRYVRQLPVGDIDGLLDHITRDRWHACR